MGNLIICNGVPTTKPYYHKVTGTSIYSIEELCYYIYNNIDIMNNEFLNESLAKWIDTELKLGDRGEKLLELMGKNASMKDIIVFILCSADYYSESEIKKLIVHMDNFSLLTPLEKKKKTADNFLKYKKYNMALNEYEEILFGKESVKLTSIEYGNLLHNLAIAKLNTKGAYYAANDFKHAYEGNHNELSLKQYLMALKISKQEEAFVNAVSEYNISKEYIETIDNSLEIDYLELENSKEMKVIEELMEYKRSGNISKFYQTADEVIYNFKEEFRLENA
jgi:hypothetical protein